MKCKNNNCKEDVYCCKLCRQHYKEKIIDFVFAFSSSLQLACPLLKPFFYCTNCDDRTLHDLTKRKNQYKWKCGACQHYNLAVFQNKKERGLQASSHR